MPGCCTLLKVQRSVQCIACATSPPLLHWPAAQAHIHIVYVVEEPDSAMLPELCLCPKTHCLSRLLARPLHQPVSTGACAFHGRAVEETWGQGLSQLPLLRVPLAVCFQATATHARK